MNIWNDIDAFPASRNPVVATIGNFDGVHRGHRAILDAVRRDAQARAARALLISFEPHPLSVVAPQAKPALLQTRRQKLAALETTGIDDVLLLPFDRALADLDGNEFFTRLLDRTLRFAALHVGDNFRFGRGRGGDLELLRRLGRERGFTVDVVPPVLADGAPVSSSAIRAMVAAGQVERAHAMLGRPYAIEGEVATGAGRGRLLRFPTANVEPENELLPARGVYVTECIATATRYGSVTNVGSRPTFDGDELVVESHLLGFEGDLYRRRLELRFLARLRDERKFADAAELAGQIARDRDAAVAYFSDRAPEPR